MSNYFWHPMAPESLNITYPRTRYNHGVGKLDFWNDYVFNLPIHAMCTGKIIFKGTYSDGNYVLVQECSNSMLDRTFYIRYLHGIWLDNIIEGQICEAGTLLGHTSTNGGMYNDHLHIDFSWTPYDFDPVQGYLSEDYSTITISGTIYNIHDININHALNFQRTDRGASGSNIPMGYCWLVFAQDPIFIDGSSGDDDYIEINKKIYDNCKGVNENEDGVNFYFNGIVNNNFCGPYPANWDIVNSPQCKGLRRMVNVCYHEFGLINKFAFVSFAKLLRAGFCCNKGIYSTWGLDADNLDQMIINVSNNSQFIGTLADNTDVLKSDITLEQIKAIYNNFKYPNIYGTDLYGTIDPVEYKELIIQGINSLPTMNGFQDTGTYKGYTMGYPTYPPYFLTAYYYPSKKKVHNGQLDYGTFIFYRYINQVHEPNPKVL